MIKVVSVINTFIIPRCFAQHQNHGDMEMSKVASNQNYKINSKTKTSYKDIQSKITQISKYISKN